VADAPIARARVIADEDLEALPRIRRRGYGLAEDTAWPRIRPPALATMAGATTYFVKENPS